MAGIRGLSLILVVSALAGCASHSFTIRSENDSFSPAGKEYTNYSNGLQFSFAPTEPWQPCREDCNAAAAFVDWINLFDSTDQSPDSERFTWLNYGLGQQFFTPDDLSIPTLQEDERPYAGWLFGFLDISNEVKDSVGGAHYRNNVGLRLGVVGPDSLAEDLQRLWHERCDCVDPQGWDHQLKNEPGIEFIVGQDRRLFRHDISESWSYDLIGSTSASIGNVYTGASVGGTFRLGWNLDHGWGFKTMNDVGFHERPTASPDPGIYVFAGMTGRFVVRDIFLDGNTWQSSHSVQSKPLVYDQTVGFGLHWRQLDINISYVYRSEQYTTQAEPTRFASIGLSWRPWQE